MQTLCLRLTQPFKRGLPQDAEAAHIAGPWRRPSYGHLTEMLQMKYMHKAIWQADGNLVIRGNSRALLFRALQDANAELQRKADDIDPQLFRTLQALQDVLGRFDGSLPSAIDLLGDPKKEQVARNLLKG